MMRLALGAAVVLLVLCGCTVAGGTLAIRPTITYQRHGHPPQHVGLPRSIEPVSCANPLVCQ